MKRPYAFLLSTLALVLNQGVSPAAEPGDSKQAWPEPEWQTAEPAAVGMNADKLAEVGQLLKASGAKTGLVVRHGKIVGEWYFDGADRATKLLDRVDQPLREPGRRVLRCRRSVLEPGLAFSIEAGQPLIGRAFRTPTGLGGIDDGPALLADSIHQQLARLERQPRVTVRPHGASLDLTAVTAVSLQEAPT